MIQIKKIIPTFSSYFLLKKKACKMGLVLKNSKKTAKINSFHILKEFKFCEEMINSSTSDIVFCHNDIWGGNIMR